MIRKNQPNDPKTGLQFFGNEFSYEPIVLIRGLHGDFFDFLQIPLIEERPQVEKNKGWSSDPPSLDYVARNDCYLLEDGLPEGLFPAGILSSCFS